MMVYRGMRARDFARMLYGGRVGEYMTTDPGLAAWYARLWAEVHRDPEPGVVAVFQVDPNRLVPDEYGYEAGARNVEFRVLGGLHLEDFMGIAGADGFEPRA
jgi:hypothetical protein